MPPPDPPEAGEPFPEPTPEKEPGQPIADCFRAIEEDSENGPGREAARQSV
jgi:hypothetical protein